jgi:hypothetical protein
VFTMNVSPAALYRVIDSRPGTAVLIRGVGPRRTRPSARSSTPRTSPRSPRPMRMSSGASDSASGPRAVRWHSRARIWDSAAAERDVPEGTEIVVCFAAARQRDNIAIVGCTADEPHVFSIRTWESSVRIEPVDVADEFRAARARYSVRDLLCSEADWSWVLLQLADEGLPVTKGPRNPQRLALQWQTFFDAALERRLTHAPDPTLARHVANLSLISCPSGLRPDLDVARGQPMGAAIGAMVTFDGVTRLESRVEPFIGSPSAGCGDAVSMSLPTAQHERRANMFGSQEGERADPAVHARP